jgi:hypothetical protein
MDRVWLNVLIAYSKTKGLLALRAGHQAFGRLWAQLDYVSAVRATDCGHRKASKQILSFSAVANGDGFCVVGATQPMLVGTIT